MFNLEVRIGNFLREVSLAGETDIDGNTFCALKLGADEIDRYWYPDAEISVRSKRQGDEVEAIAFQRGTEPFGRAIGKADRIPVIFEVSRLVH